MNALLVCGSTLTTASVAYLFGFEGVVRLALFVGTMMVVGSLANRFADSEQEVER